MSPITLSIADAAALIGVSRSTIYKLINTQRLKAIKIGTRTLITMASVETLLAPSSMEAQA